jgi:hypothetical protein
MDLEVRILPDGSQGIGTRVRAGRAAGARSPAIVTTNRFLLDTSVLHHVTRRQPPTRTGPRPAGWSPSASRPRRLVSLPSAPRPVRRMTALAPTTRRIAPTEVPWAVSETCKPANPVHRRQLRHAEHRGHPQSVIGGLGPRHQQERTARGHRSGPGLNQLAQGGIKPEPQLDHLQDTP